MAARKTGSEERGNPVTADGCEVVNRDGAAALVRLRREMRVRFASALGPVEGSLLDTPGFRMSADAFAFEPLADLRFHYRIGEGVTADVSGPAGRAAFDLYLWGTVFGAVAWLNGFFPLHASAVAERQREGRGSRVIAFTADSGGGKSTLAAALCGHGFAHFCDDTLVLAARGEEVIALPDGKPLKLWDGAFRLAGARRLEPIGNMPGKFFAAAGSSSDETARLTDLIFLEKGESVRLEPLTGSAKLAALTQALYRDAIHAARANAADHARLMMNVARNVRFWRLARPFDELRFEAVLSDIARLIRASGGS